MTSTTWTSDAWERTRRTNRVAYIHYWLSIFGLATADCLSFLLVDLFIRSSHSVPTIAVFLGRANAGDPTPINVFAVLCMLFVVLRYLSSCTVCCSEFCSRSLSCSDRSSSAAACSPSWNRTGCRRRGSASSVTRRIMSKGQWWSSCSDWRSSPSAGPAVAAESRRSLPATGGL